MDDQSERVTYYVVQPFVRAKHGSGVVPGQPQLAPSRSAAERMAVRLGSVGAIAFARSGDMTTGDWDDAVVIKRVGEVTEELQLVG